MYVEVLAPILVAVIIWATRVATKTFEQHSTEHLVLQEAHLFQIKATLLFMYRHAKDRGNKITTQEMDVFNDLYSVYTKLGGNGFIDTIRQKMNELEIIDD